MPAVWGPGSREPRGTRFWRTGPRSVLCSRHGVRSGVEEGLDGLAGLLISALRLPVRACRQLRPSWLSCVPYWRGRGCAAPGSGHVPLRGSPEGANGAAAARHQPAVTTTIQTRSRRIWRPLPLTIDQGHHTAAPGRGPRERNPGCWRPGGHTSASCSPPHQPPRRAYDPPIAPTASPRV